MAFNGPYWINVFWNSMFGLDNGVVNTFNNMADGGFMITERLSYEQVVQNVCMEAGWRYGMVKIKIIVIFDFNGSKRPVPINVDSHLELIYMLPSMACIDMYVQKEDVAESSRGQSVRVTRNTVNTSYQFEQMEEDDEYNEAEDEDYTGGIDSSDSDRSVSGESDDSGDERQEQEEARVQNSGRIVKGHYESYSELGPSNPSRVDRQPGRRYVTWDGEVDSLRHGMCFHSKEEMKRVVIAWSVVQKREFYVRESTTKTWVAWCLSLKNRNPERGCTPCQWKIRASKLPQKHGLWELTVWQPEHNCYSIAVENGHRNVSSSFIARLVVTKVLNDFEYSVSVVRTDVKALIGIDVGYKKAWHGKRKAIESVYGDWCGNVAILPR